MVIEALHRPQRSVRLRVAVTLVAGSALLLALLARLASAQSPPSASAGDTSSTPGEMMMPM